MTYTAKGVGEFVDMDKITSLEINMRHKAMVRNLMKPMRTESDDIMHAAIGISGEAGELLDAIKKHWVYNRQLDVTNIVEELGDIEFYMQMMRQLLNLDRDEILQLNISKLSKRYSSGKYSDQQAQARADKPEEQKETPKVPYVRVDPFTQEAAVVREYNARNDEIERNRV